MQIFILGRTHCSALGLKKCDYYELITLGMVEARCHYAKYRALSLFYIDKSLGFRFHNRGSEPFYSLGI